jgi:Ca-activated chloride channel family protein
MGSGSYSSLNTFSGYGTFTISLPLSQVEYQPVDVMLVMDVSGSMSWTDDKGQVKIELAKTAAIKFVQNLTMSRDRVGLVSFATDAYLKCTLTNNTDQIVNAINNLVTGGSTNMGGGISISNKEFVGNGRPNAVWVMILLSDGKANLPENEESARQYAIEQAECAKILMDKGVKIYTIGLGSPDYLDEDLLKQIAFDESKYYLAPTADQLASIYWAISRDILLQVRYDIVIIQLNIQGSG